MSEHDDEIRAKLAFLIDRKIINSPFDTGMIICEFFDVAKDLETTKKLLDEAIFIIEMSVKVHDYRDFPDDISTRHYKVVHEFLAKLSKEERMSEYKNMEMIPSKGTCFHCEDAALTNIKLQKENEQMKDILKFIFNPYSAPEETLRRVSEKYEEVQECLAKLGER